MKKRIFALLQACVLVFAASACGTSDTQGVKGETPSLIFATGDHTGSYFAFGNLLSGYMGDAAGADIEVVSTEGSVANINGVNEGICQLALAQADVMSYAWSGIRAFTKDESTRSFRAIGGLYEEAVQIVTLDESIQRVSDLKGKTVSIGAEDSGVALNAMTIFDIYGLRTGDDIKTVNLSFGESIEAMKEGEVDAAFIVSGTPTKVVEDLIAAEHAHLVNIDGRRAEELMERYPYYNKHVILSGTYPGLNQDVSTVSVQATVIVSADLPEEDVYHLTAGIYDNSEAISAILERGIQVSVENATTGVPVPFHAGAARYFEEHGFTVPVE
ncbi:MAG: TAXI family TRAP transporter solute-binding subunit [Bacillota bacterium]|nr:TAXI family TRAP transporter solute-binding subunit [Bacillota bacterium]